MTIVDDRFLASNFPDGTEFFTASDLPELIGRTVRFDFSIADWRLVGSRDGYLSAGMWVCCDHLKRKRGGWVTELERHRPVAVIPEATP